MTTIDSPTAAGTAQPPQRTWPRRAVLAGSGVAVLACAACGSKSAASSAPTTTAAPGVAAAIASVADIPADSGLIATAPSGPVILATAAGKVVAHTAVCTHQGATIDGSGTCPLHGSKFNPATGAVLNGPATEPLAAVTVTEKDGKVYAG